MRFLRILTLGLLCVLSPFVRAEGVEHYLANAEGRVTIGPDGRVVEAQIDSDLGKSLNGVLLSQIRTWRFEPIVENGQAVTALAYMEMRLRAWETKDHLDSGIEVARVSFIDPPDVAKARLRSAKTAMPRYPVQAVRERLGADVEVTVKVGAQGEVLEAGISDLWLISPAQRIRKPEKFMAWFTASAVHAVSQWHFDPPSDGVPYFASVPIRYYVGGYGEKPQTWRRAHPVTLVPETWMEEARSVAVLSETGEAPSRLRLLTEPTPEAATRPSS